MSISNDIVSTKIYEQRNDSDFEFVNFPLLDGDVPRSTSYGVYISQLIRFARESSYVADFNIHNKLLTQKLLKQGYQYHTCHKIVSEYDQEIPQSQTADNPVVPRGRAAQPSRDTRKTNKAKQSVTLSHQDDCNTRMDIK